MKQNFGIITSDYDGFEAIRHSHFKELYKTPAHYKRAIAVKKNTSSMGLGSAYHCLLLEQEKFQSQFAVLKKVKNGSWNLKDNQTHKKQFLKTNADKTVLTEDQYETALTMYSNTVLHPTVAKLMKAKQKHFELGIWWTCPVTGLKKKAKLDFCYYSEQNEAWILADVKSTKSVEPDSFARDAAKMDYLSQFAWYLEGMEIVLGKVGKPFFICCQNSAPFEVQIYRFPLEQIELYKSMIQQYMQLLKTCIERNHFPSYEMLSKTQSQIIEINLPKFKINQLESKITQSYESNNHHIGSSERNLRTARSNGSQATTVQQATQSRA